MTLPTTLINRRMFVFLLAFISSVLGNIDIGSITVGGVSSGAAIALQASTAYSSQFSGVALVAGVPYYCSRNSLTYAEECVLTPSLVPVQTLEDDMDQFVINGQIDSLSNFKSQSLYLFSGALDTVVSPGTVRLIEQIARDLGVTKILTEYSIEAEHCVPTDDWGLACYLLSEPFINNCAYDMAGRALTHMYGPLNPPVTPIDSNVITLSQAKFTPGKVDPSTLSMATDAYLYVPTNCKTPTANCTLHVSFHGCLQGTEEVGLIYVNHAGWNKWAESNNMIILYPQAIISILDPINLDGCWDWWGYTNEEYAFKNSTQLLTIMNMVNYIVQNY